jgi:DNA-binding transcriptional regulator YhcF (GntR family)
VVQTSYDRAAGRQRTALRRWLGAIVIISVKPESALPPYEQVRTQIAEAIESGALAAETRLPTVRQLAGDLGLAVNTVARAYRELETEGLVETRGRHGSFVAPLDTTTRRQAVRATRTFASAMRRLGIGPQEMLALLRRELADELPGDGDGATVAGARS